MIGAAYVIGRILAAVARVIIGLPISPLVGAAGVALVNDTYRKV